MNEDESGDSINVKVFIDRISTKIKVYENNIIINSSKAISLKKELMDIIGSEDSIEIIESPINNSDISKGQNQGCYALKMTERKILNRVIEHLNTWQREDSKARKIELKIEVGRTKELNFEMSDKNNQYEDKLRRKIHTLWK